MFGGYNESEVVKRAENKWLDHFQWNDSLLIGKISIAAVTYQYRDHDNDRNDDKQEALHSFTSAHEIADDLFVVFANQVVR
jgi:hypothetical protein